MTMRIWLAIWGGLACIALALPGVVALGLFLLVPGLVLLAAPTVFVYSAAFALVRPLLPMGPGVLRNAAAAGLVLALGWVAAQPGAIAGRQRFARANLPDVVPPSPVRLAGHIRLELPEDGRANRREPSGACPALCAVLLDTPEVESVTLAVAGQTAWTFRLVARGGDRSRGADLVRPEAILKDLQQEAESRRSPGGRIVVAAGKEDEQAVAAEWALRLALRDRLSKQPAAGSSPDMTVRFTEVRDRRSGKELAVSRVEILDAGGQALLRRSNVTASALAAPLHFSGKGSLESFRIGLGRVALSSGASSGELKPVTELFLHSSLARPTADTSAMPVLLERLGSACANPALTRDAAELGLADLWLATIDWRNPLRAKELSVLACVIADERIPLPERLYDGYESNVAPELRAALGNRIVSVSTPPKTRMRLARLLAKLPEATFTSLSAAEQAILHSSELRAEAYPMIVRLADQEEAAVPQLLDILRNDMQAEPWSRRVWVMRAVALAFAVLGPKAHAALEEVDALVNVERSRLMNTSADRKRWYLALARMGKPIEEFRWFNSKAEGDARDRESLRRQVERFDRTRVWDY